MTHRSAFVLRVRPDKVDEYVDAPPERVAGDARGPPRSRESGTTRSSARATTCSGYFESERARSRRCFMEAQEVNARWQDAMAGLLEERCLMPARRVSRERIFRLD